jgi:two-component sensor histidine kinase
MARLRRALREMEEIENRILIDRSTETARAEGRVLPLLGLVVILLLVALVFGYRLVTRAAHAEAEAAQAEALAEARDRADLLAHELNHRVKNMFAVVLAIVRMSARDAPEAKPVTESIAQRIHALLTAHEVTQGTLDKPVASLRSLVETTLAPYRSDQCEAVIEGPEVMLPSNRVTPLGLMLHELTTNAVKYGAWSCGGRIGVRWEQNTDAVLLRWQEEGVTMEGEPERQGFGSMLMTGSARQLGGSIERSFDAGGVLVTITIPLGSDA